MINVIWMPDAEEIESITTSAAAKNSFENNEALFYSDVVKGQRVRLAFIQSGTTAVEEVTVIGAGNLVDLRSVLNNWRK